jgi:hypothetical protein
VYPACPLYRGASSRGVPRTEPATNNVTDYGINKAIDHLPALRDKMAAVIDNYLDVQQDILETFVDRRQLRNLAQPTLTATGKRIPGLKLDNPRQLALMHTLVRSLRSRQREPSAPRKSTRIPTSQYSTRNYDAVIRVSNSVRSVSEDRRQPHLALQPGLKGVRAPFTKIVDL